MASGTTHNAASIGAAAPLAVGTGLVAYGLGADAAAALVIGGSVGGGCLGGIVLTPDLDEITVTKGEWLIVKWLPIVGWLWLAIWDLYARAIPHRNVLSHLPILGTLGRLIYLGGFLYGLWLLIGRPPLPPSPPAGVMVGALLGLSLSDTLHWVMDGCPVRWIRQAHHRWRGKR